MSLFFLLWLVSCRVLFVVCCVVCVRRGLLFALFVCGFLCVVVCCVVVVARCLWFVVNVFVVVVFVRCFFVVCYLLFACLFILCGVRCLLFVVGGVLLL